MRVPQEDKKYISVIESIKMVTEGWCNKGKPKGAQPWKSRNGDKSMKEVEKAV